jgi:hypothetical protein
VGVWFANGTFFNASDVLHAFGGIDRSTSTGAAAVAALQNGSYALTERRGLLGSMDLLPTSDGGDIACQGSLNAMQIITTKLRSGNDSALALVKKWLVSVPLDVDTDGRVWDSSNQQYHQKKQGAWEAAAEWVLMARLYAAHSGNLELFSSSIDRILCTEDAGSGAKRVASMGGNASLCTTPLEDIKMWAPTPALELGDVYEAQITGRPVATRDTPRLQIAAAKRLVQRFTTGPHPVAALIMPIEASWSRVYAATLCLKDAASGAVVYRAALSSTTPNTITPAGWLRVLLQTALPALTTFDVALTADPTQEQRSTERSPTWLTRMQVEGGRGRIETWGYVHAESAGGGSGQSRDVNGSCCTQGNAASESGTAPTTTLAARLEIGMQWQLELARRTTASAEEGGGGASAPTFGALVVRDAYVNGVPATGKGTSSASSMWDQVRMGWKPMYINALFLASVDAWIELEDVSAVRSLQELVGVSARVVRSEIAADIDAQFGYDVSVPVAGGAPQLQRGYLSWISCNATDEARGLSTCPLHGAVTHGDGQRAIDGRMLPDQAWAVKLGLGGAPARARLDAMLTDARIDGLVRNNLVPFESIDPRICTAADKWDPVDSRGFCVPGNGGGMRYSGHCVCTPDDPIVGGPFCTFNFGYNQQNGGRVFATQSTLYEAGPYRGSLDDFTTTVLALRAIVAQLRSSDPAATPLLDENRGFLRTPIPNDIVRTMCMHEHHYNASTIPDKDAWGADVCAYVKDLTYGLRTGPRGVLIAFAAGHLGLHVGANRTLVLWGQPVSRNVVETVRLPDAIAARWPAALKGVSLGGVRVGATSVDVACNVTSSAGSTGLRCELAWST